MNDDPLLGQVPPPPAAPQPPQPAPQAVPKVSRAISVHSATLIALTFSTVLYGSSIAGRIRQKKMRGDLDMLLDFDVVPLQFQWLLVITLSHLALLAHRVMELRLLQGNQEGSVFQSLIRNNHLVSLLSLVFMDRNYVFMTALEYLVFTLVYLIHSFTYASSFVIELYIKKVRDILRESRVGD